MDSSSFRPREMIPLWKSLEDTPAPELSPTIIAQKISDQATNKLRDLSLDFEKYGGIDEAAELIEAAIVFGPSKLAHSAANLILRQSNLPSGLRSIAIRINPTSLETVLKSQVLQPNLNVDQGSQRKISHLRVALNERPRDGFLAIEIGRLHFLNGQHQNALKYAERAIRTYPNSRYILRAISCLCDRIGELDRALHFIRKSSTLSHDPWVQSAEIAISASLGKFTKVPQSVLSNARNSKSAEVSKTELAASLASLELHAGKRKSARKLMENSMLAPNENSLAQLRWFQKAGDFAQRVVPMIDLPTAYEAKAYEALNVENVDVAIANSICWFNEQPFQVSSALLASSLSLSVTRNFAQALNVLTRAVDVNPNSFALKNNKLVALCMMNKTVEAKTILNNDILVHRSNDSEVPFKFAAQGLVAFCEGNFAEGREYYANAISSAASDKNGSLVVMALIYYLGQELSSGQASLADVKELVANVEKITVKNRVLRRSIKLNWDAFKKRLADHEPLRQMDSQPCLRETTKAALSFLSSNVGVDFGEE
jgi:tetratricopeptide (TPR) repeat protein